MKVKLRFISLYLAMMFVLITMFSSVTVFANETSNETGSVNSITLAVSESGVATWTVDGNSDMGFKLVWSKNAAPEYPTRDGDTYHYYGNADTVTGQVENEEAGLYHVRVCEYLGGKCGVYSNEVEVNLTLEEASETAAVNSITLTVDENGIAHWTVDGNSPKGFKLVWSKNAAPTYPNRDGDTYRYYDDASTVEGRVDPFKGAGLYYVRVCEYLGGACGVYSNEVSVSLAGYEEVEETTTAPDVDKPTVVEVEEFADVKSSHDNFEAINYLKETEVVLGYDGNVYKPSQEISRAEFVKIVVEARVGVPDAATYKNCFSDVKEGWEAPYVCYARSEGWVNGYADGTFKPGENVNFVEVSKIVAIAFALPVNESLDDNWYEKFVKALEDAAAAPASIMAFDEKINRGEMAEIVWRLDTNNEAKEYVSYDTLEKVESERAAEVAKAEEEAVVEGPVKSITLSVDDTSATWSVDGYSANGFKVVWSKNSAPTYPTRDGDKYKYLADSGSTKASLDAFSGEGVYYVRVCEYLGGACGVYSNQVAVKLGAESDDSSDDSGDAAVKSIQIKDLGNGVMKWEVNGTSEKGFKLVWSKNSAPTYPTRDGDKYEYIPDSRTTQGSISAFDGSGVYNVRVCEYLGGACGVYSNEIQVSL